MRPARALRRALAVAGVAAACASPPAPPEPYAVGDRLEPFALADAHGEEHRVDASLRTILFARDMDADAAADEVLAEAPSALLAEREAVYVSDISGMPGVITRLVALPRLRERSYTLLLDREGEATARLPAEEGRVTLLRLDPDLRIVRIRHLADPQALREALGLAPAAPETSRGDPRRERESPEM